jgi:hypothetical protein
LSRASLKQFRLTKKEVRVSTFHIGSTTVHLSGVQIVPVAKTLQEDAWLPEGMYITVRVSAPVEGIRVHTNGRSFPLPHGKIRPKSYPSGTWVLIGDKAISTSSEIVSSFSLPGVFTHIAKAVIPPCCLINVGVCSRLWGGRGGGIQVEYVNGPEIQFTQAKDKFWHSVAGNA